MGLACSQAVLLTLTQRKADCEYGITIGSTEKHALAREMTQLSQEYNRRLKTKDICYYADNNYHKMNYKYLMGMQGNNDLIFSSSDQRRSESLKDDNNVVLTDYTGRVVMDQDYTKKMIECGLKEGETFSKDKIPELIAKVANYEISTVQDILNGNPVYKTNTYQNKETLTSKYIGDTYQKETDVSTQLEAVVDFYYNIFAAASANGWTSEYKVAMQSNENYISDAILSGTFQLATVNSDGSYSEGTCLTYYMTTGLFETNTSSDSREEITAWYNAEKSRISEKETLVDLEINELSTELESINTEIQSIKSLIDDAVSSVFDWGSG